MNKTMLIDIEPTLGTWLSRNADNNRPIFETIGHVRFNAYGHPIETEETYFTGLFCRTLDNNRNSRLQ